MSVSLSQLRTATYGILRETENCAAYPYTLVDWFINSAQLRYCSGLLTNPFNGQIVQKGKLPFLKKDAYFSNVSPTYTTADVAVGATTIPATTTWYASAWALFINWNIVTYTGVTSTSFTGCSNVLFAFIWWTEISQAFTVPTDFMSPIQMIYNSQFKLNCMNYDDIYENLKQYSGNYLTEYWTSLGLNYSTVGSPFYTIKDGAYIIIFNINQTLGQLHLRYEKKPTTLTATSDTLTIDNDIYGLNIISQYAAAEMLYHRWEEARASQMINFVISQAKESYRYYDNIGYETQSWIRFSVGKSGRILNI